MTYSIALHIIGLVFWLGGMAVLTRFMQILALEDAGSAALDGFRKLTRRAWFGFILVGLALSTATGLYQVISVGVSYYMKQGWFHGKLTLIIILYAVTWFVGLEVARASRGIQLSKRRLNILHGITSLILVVIVFLTIVGRAS